MLAVIGGSGWEALPGFKLLGSHLPETPYGELVSPLVEGQLDGQQLLFLSRHGEGHRLAPHKINYRANLWALKSKRVSQVLAINAVGGIGPDSGPGQLICPDQLIDYTWGRAQTFFDDPVEHIEFAEPFDLTLRQSLLRAAYKAGIGLVDGGVYGCTQGPRLETRAEIERLRRDGCTLVGMTAMPEAALARELGLAYASVCISVNWAAGLSSEPITMDAILGVLAQSRTPVLTLISALSKAGADAPL